MKQLKVVSQSARSGASVKKSRREADAPAKRRVAPAVEGPLVSVTTVGGYRVYGSVLRPKHATPQQIAEAFHEAD